MQYASTELRRRDVLEDPIQQFDKWMQEAMDAHVENLSVMNLSTASKQGAPASRIVLLRGYDSEGFIFFTNYNSSKGKHIAENPQAALNFWWPEMGRQIRIQGTIEKISPERSDDYFESRPTESNVSAAASPQSDVIPDRKNLEERVSQLLSEGRVKRPDYWGGYVVKPNTIEFWQSRSDRLHDRILYSREGDSWTIQRLAP